MHIMTTDVHFFNKALFKDRNFILSAIMFFAVGFVLLPTLALTSPMLEELLDYPVDTTGYMTLARGVTLVGAVVLMSFAPARIDNRLFIIGGMALVVYANWLMLGYSPAMDWRLVVAAKPAPGYRSWHVASGGICSVGTCHGAKPTGRPGDYSDRRACCTKRQLTTAMPIVPLPQ